MDGRQLRDDIETVIAKMYFYYNRSCFDYQVGGYESDDG